MAPSAVQWKIARILAGISRAELAKLSGVSAGTIANAERGDVRLIRANVEMLMRAFDALGIQFLERDGVQRREATKPAPRSTPRS